MWRVARGRPDRRPRPATVSVNLSSALLQQAMMTMSPASLQEAQKHVCTALERMAPQDPSRAAVLQFAANLEPSGGDASPIVAYADTSPQGARNALDRASGISCRPGWCWLGG